MTHPYGDAVDDHAAAAVAGVCDADRSCHADDLLRSIRVVLSSDVRDGATVPRTLHSLDELRWLICRLPRCPRSYALEAARQLAPMSPTAHAEACDVAAMAPGDCVWVHCKNFTDDELREVLSWLPLHPSTVHRIEHHRDVTEDVTEYYPTHGYLYAQLRACVCDGDGGDERRCACTHDQAEQRVPLLLVAYDTLLFSYCSATFAGESNALFDAMVPSDTAAAAAAAATATVVARQESDLCSRTASDVLMGDELGGGGGGSSSLRTRASAATSHTTRGLTPHNVASVFSALVYTVVLRLQRRVSTLLLHADHLDELMLQIQPSVVDQNDLLLRVKELRHRVARLHVELLQKERLLKHLLLLPQLPDATTALLRVCGDAVAVARYQLAAAVTRRDVEKLRRARDLVNTASMNLISGVSARLLRHCYHMDYLNNVQTQISLVLMPISILPALWASNVKVPWQDIDSLVPFYGLTAVTFALTLIGVGIFCIRFFTFKMPGAIVTTFE